MAITTDSVFDKVKLSFSGQRIQNIVAMNGTRRVWLLNKEEYTGSPTTPPGMSFR